MKVVIASDFHLKSREDDLDRARRERVVRFLRSLRGNADILVLAGDVFDLWFAWRTVVIRGYFPILRELADLVESGVRVVFLAGNHDFWFRGFLSDELGLEVLPDSWQATVDGKKLFVSHGDLYTSNDLRYQLFRRLIRNRPVMTLFELLHPDVALGLGGLLSRTSRRARTPQPLLVRKRAGLRRKGAQLLERGYQVVVFGHTHEPGIEHTDKGVIANSGDWIRNSTYVLVENGKTTLHTFEIPSEEDS